MIQTFLRTADAKAAKDKIRAGVDFMNTYGLKRLPVENFVLVRENGHINVLKETVSRKDARHPALGFVRVHVEKKMQNCGRIVL